MNFESEDDKRAYDAEQLRKQEQHHEERNALHSKQFSFHCRLELQYEVMPVHVQ